MSTWVPSTSVFVPTFELGRPLRVLEVQEAHHQVKMIKQIGKEFEDGNLLVCDFGHVFLNTLILTDWDS